MVLGVLGLLVATAAVPASAQDVPVLLEDVLSAPADEDPPMPLLSGSLFEEEIPQFDLFETEPVSAEFAEEIPAIGPEAGPVMSGPLVPMAPSVCPPTGGGPACCLRGRDHVGDLLFHSAMGQWLASREPILEWHNPFFTWSDCWVIPACRYRDYCRCQRSLQFDAPVGGTGYGDRSFGDHLRAMHCAMQCKWVNFRPGSQYLRGCMPEGYYLLPFIRSAPNIDFHSAPLNPDMASESAETNTLEARAADGDAYKPITMVSVDISLPEGSLPTDTAKESFSKVTPRMHVPGTGRNWCAVTFQWNASLLNHQPLYFEDVNLERHGYSWGLAQPAVSGAKFMGTVLALPYLMTAYPPHLNRYDLGNARPGSPTPYVHQRVPLHLDAVLVEAGVIAGLYLLIP